MMASVRGRAAASSIASARLGAESCCGGVSGLGGRAVATQGRLERVAAWIASGHRGSSGDSAMRRSVLHTFRSSLRGYHFAVAWWQVRRQKEARSVPETILVGTILRVQGITRG